VICNFQFISSHFTPRDVHDDDVCRCWRRPWRRGPRCWRLWRRRRAERGWSRWWRPRRRHRRPRGRQASPQQVEGPRITRTPWQLRLTGCSKGLTQRTSEEPGLSDDLVIPAHHKQFRAPRCCIGDSQRKMHTQACCILVSAHCYSTGGAAAYPADDRRQRETSFVSLLEPSNALFGAQQSAAAGTQPARQLQLP